VSISFLAVQAGLWKKIVVFEKVNRGKMCEVVDTLNIFQCGVY
jgi:hypothetical protein